MPSLLRHDGELEIDHRASPGLTPDEARAAGLEGGRLSEGSLVHAPVLACNHCGGVQLMNPWRTRERGYCRLCDHYVCDLCKAVMSDPDYAHYTITQLTDMVMSGRWRLAGPTTKPILIPVGVDHG
jgi:hypothetical protein